jgi:hypothetical protein
MDTGNPFNFPLASKIPRTATLVWIETKEESSKGIQTPLEAWYRHLLETPFHEMLQMNNFTKKLMRKHISCLLTEGLALSGLNHFD